MTTFPSILIGKRKEDTNPFDISDGHAVHFLKIEKQHFIDVRSGKKKAEFRRNDRDFRKGDAVVLIEIEKKKETGRFVIAEIDHILFDFEHKKLPAGFAMLSIHVVFPDRGIRAFYP